MGSFYETVYSFVSFCTYLKVKFCPAPNVNVVHYSHLSNKRGGGAKFAKLLNVEVGINVEDGIFWKKLVHNSNKRGVEGGKI